MSCVALLAGTGRLGRHVLAALLQSGTRSTNPGDHTASPDSSGTPSFSQHELIAAPLVDTRFAPSANAPLTTGSLGSDAGASQQQFGHLRRRRNHCIVPSR